MADVLDLNEKRFQPLPHQRQQLSKKECSGTRLADYGLTESCIPAICSNLKRFGLTALGEQQDIDPDKVARILSHAL